MTENKLNTEMSQPPRDSKFNPEQWRAIQLRGDNILVAASAGSGKTTVLIERIMNHLLTGFASIDQLLVVTFTEVAASEMKERMKIRLKSALRTAKDSEQRAYLSEQIQRLPAAHIQTLHSFCYQLIQAYSQQIDLDPATNLMTDPVREREMLEICWQDLVFDIYQAQENSPLDHSQDSVSAKDYLDLLLAFSKGRSDQEVKDMVISLYYFALSHPEPETWNKTLVDKQGDLNQFFDSPLFEEGFGPYLQAQVMTIYKLYRQSLDLIATASDLAQEVYGAFIEAEQAPFIQANEALLANDYPGLFSAMTNIHFAMWPNKKKKGLEEDVEIIDAAKEFRDKAKKKAEKLTELFPYSWETQNQIELALVKPVKVLQDLTLAFIKKVKAYKQSEKIMDFSDLEHLTLEILAPYNSKSQKREASLVAKVYQQVFQEVLVDEYQDINEIQATILSFLSHEQVLDLPGNLFMVGDVKQSIYGFRMAEPSLFLQKYYAYQQGQGGQLIILDKNYRSRYEILNFTNYLFERIMDQSFGEMDYGEAERLVCGNKSFLPGSDPSSFAIECLIYPKKSLEGEENSEAEKSFDQEEDLEFDQSIDAEAALIAQDIQEKIASGFMVYDKKTKINRPLRFSDIVVLSRSSKCFAPLQKALGHFHIPLLSQAIESYFQRYEVQILLALLKVIDNPQQDLALTAVLRSFFVGLSDSDLARIRVAHPQVPYYQAVHLFVIGACPSEAELGKIWHKLQAFYQQLRVWQSAGRIQPIEDLIWQIYQETYILDYMAGLDNGLQRQANLHAFYEKAKEISLARNTSLSGYITYIETLLEQDKDLAEPLMLDADQNAVRAMTVHASKGAEFPLVYLMNTAKAFNKKEIQQPVIATKHLGIGMHLVDIDQVKTYQSLSRKAREIVKLNQAKAEEMRILYVALTRAEQKLIIVGTLDHEEAWDKVAQSSLDLANGQELLVDYQERSSATNWLTWIIQASSLRDRGQAETSHLTAQDWKVRFKIPTQDSKKEPAIQNLKVESNWLNDQIESELEFQAGIPTVVSGTNDSLNRIKHLMMAEYPHRLSTSTAAYQSVSELKRLYEEPSHDQLAHFSDRSKKPSQNEGVQGIRFTRDSFTKPNFMIEKVYDSARIGTLNHYLMQKLNYQAFFNLPQNQYAQRLNQEIQDLVSVGSLKEQDLDYLYIDKILTFLQSELGQLMIQHYDRLRREQPFSSLIPAPALFAKLDQADIKTSLVEDSILVHGVIDAYFVRENLGFILVDFKTDRYRANLEILTREAQIQALKDKYRYQLSLYANALETHLGVKAHRVVIAALDFEENIVLDDLIEFSTN